MKFNSAKCNSMNLGANSRNSCYQLEVIQQEKDFGRLITHCMIMS